MESITTVQKYSKCSEGFGGSRKVEEGRERGVRTKYHRDFNLALRVSSSSSILLDLSVALWPS